MPVFEVQNATTPVVDAVAHLMPQLSRSAPKLDQQGLQAILDQPGVYMFLFVDENVESLEAAGSDDILGMLTLVTYTIPAATRSWIEDVVVDEAARGQGAGQALVDAAVAKAAEVGAKTTDLTSQPMREAANHLYLKCGFQIRKTNVYRYQE